MRIVINTNYLLTGLAFDQDLKLEKYKKIIYFDLDSTKKWNSLGLNSLLIIVIDYSVQIYIKK